MNEIHGISVRICSDGGRYFVWDELFDLYGAGLTLEAARQDYWKAVQDYLADLETDSGRLAPYLADRLAHLHRTVKD